MSSTFSKVTAAAPIEVFQVGQKYKECAAANKVDLGIGAYRTEDGQPWVLPVVHAAEQILANDATLNHEYLPMLGYEPFCDAAVALLLGDDSIAIKEKRAFGVQCLSGTGTLRVGAEFLARVVGRNTAYMSNPTWGNHQLIFKNAGFTDLREYRYWDQQNRGLNFDAFKTDLESAPENAVIVLHACAHNPTGCDPTHEQWTTIAEICKARKLFIFFDIAYQGFASGDPNTDAWAVRHFVSLGCEMFVAQSFAKNFGLYNERIGNLCVVVNDSSTIAAVKSQLSILIRANWSNPPSHGARIVHMVLTTPEMRQQWYNCIQQMSGRIKQMRTALHSKLVQLGTPGNWDHIITQIGMFTYLGINEKQCEHLMKTHNIFLLKSGRISICGLNTRNVDHVANAIHDAVVNVSKL